MTTANSQGKWFPFEKRHRQPTAMSLNFWLYLEASECMGYNQTVTFLADALRRGITHKVTYFMSLCRSYP